MNGEYQLLIDTWEGQLELDEATLLANGVAGMLIRLNDMNGGHHMDENFINQWAQARAFCRAPYFVYNPWGSGVENYVWLANHMPADAKAVMLDIEVRMSGYAPATYAAEVRKFRDLVKSKWTTAIYTGEWFLPMLSSWPTDADYWWAQYPLEFYQDQDIPLTWDELRTRLQKYDQPFNVSKVPGRLRMWQFTGDTLVLPGSTRIIDVNVFYGSRADLENWLGKPAVSQPPSQLPGDVITTPFAGIRRISGMRHGWKFELFLSDPARVRSFEIDCLESLETVSNVAKRKGAALAFNGGEWDRLLHLKDYSVSNGVVCVERIQAVPSLMILKDKTVLIDHRAIPNVQHALSGLRYLIRDGVIQSYLSGTEPQYTEGHARSVHGVDSAGYHMCLTSEGVYSNQGLTLKQAAETMKQYGAVTAFDSGGGGDAVVVLDGVPLTVPENINPATGQHFERPLPQVLLVYAKEADMPTEDYYEYTATGNRAIRTGPGATYPRIASNSDFLFSTIARGGAAASDTVILTDITAPKVLGKAGDVWVKLYENNGKPVDGWTAKIHQGLPQVTAKFVDVTTPPAETKTITMIVDLDGYKVKTFTGDLEPE
jgi:GH25 family lysozyme M1 (1,4-beta-N-acetylmuramidase)